MRATIAGGLMVAVIGCGATAGTMGASAGTTPTTKATCTHPFPGNTVALSCVYAGGLYAVSYRFENQYYWHPPAGLFAVAEVFYKPNAPGRPAAAWAGRAISLGDGCVITEDWIPSTKHPPQNCVDSRDDEVRGATGVEQQSVLKFWQTMTMDIPASQR